MAMNLTRSFRSLAAAALLLLAAALPAQGAPSVQVNRINWAPVDGASAYLVEIRDAEGDIVFTATVEKPEAALSLAPGDYDVRITNLNKFRKPSSRSSWSKISIKRSVKPEPDSFSPGTLYSGSPDQRVEVKGEGLLPQTAVTLVGEGGTATGAVVSIDGPALTVKFDLSSLPPGSYRLEFRNPPANEAELGPLTLAPRAQPAIASISSKDFLNDRVSTGIVVEGDGLGPETKAEFRSASGAVSPAAAESLAPGKIGITWNSGQLAAGAWDLVLTNPGGLSVDSGPVFTLEDALGNPAIAAAHPLGTGTVPARAPQASPQPPAEKIVEKVVEKPVQVPVEKAVAKVVEVPAPAASPETKIVQVPVEKAVAKVVELPAQPIEASPAPTPAPTPQPTPEEKAVPVEKVVAKVVEVPVERVVEKEVTVEKIVEKKVPVDRFVEKKVPVPVGGSGGVSLLAGYAPAFSWGSFSEVFRPSFIAGSAAFQADIGNGFLNELGIFRALAFELGANYQEWPGAEQANGILPYLRVGQVSGSVVIRSHLPIPLQFSLRAGLGALSSWLSATTPFADSPVVTQSIDFSLDAGASLFWEFKGGFTVELLGEFVPFFYADGVVPAARVSLRTGWRWDSGPAPKRAPAAPQASADGSAPADGGAASPAPGGAGAQASPAPAEGAVQTDLPAPTGGQ